VVAGDDDVFYGHFVENGTVKQPPRPFLIPALEAAAPGIIAGVQRVLRGI
jgi:HK97 gp10 family phage protein